MAFKFREKGIMESFITFFTAHFEKFLSREMMVFFLSMMPVIELRGGLIAASLLKVNYIQGLLYCLIGNILPIPFVLFFFAKIVELMEKSSFTRPLASWFRKKVDKHKDAIDKVDFWGLVLFVGIPLPGTGAWTGAMVASLLKMNRKKAFLAISIGVCLAAGIMSLLSYGLLGQLI